MNLWIKGLQICERENFIITWSQLETCFNTLEDGKLLYKYKQLTSYEDFITDLIISETFNYFITSTQFGHIIVFKLDAKRKPIHYFNGHTKTVTSLCNHPISTMFISASNDNTIRIWCLDKFTELYKFKLPEGLTNIKLMNSEKFACFYNDAIKIGKLRHLAKSFANPNAFIVKIGKCF